MSTLSKKEEEKYNVIQKASNLSFCSGRLKPSRAWSSVDTLIYNPHFLFSSLNL